MGLDVTLTETRPTEVYSSNITHNLGNMASAVDLYMPLWRPEEIGITKAYQLIGSLAKGLADLENRPELKALNPVNGWGSYDGLVQFVREYLVACLANPYADVSVCR